MDELGSSWKVYASVNLPSSQTTLTTLHCILAFVRAGSPSKVRVRFGSDAKELVNRYIVQLPLDLQGQHRVTLKRGKRPLLIGHRMELTHEKQRLDKASISLLRTTNSKRRVTSGSDMFQFPFKTV